MTAVQYRSGWGRGVSRWAPGADPNPPVLMEDDHAPTTGVLDAFNAGAGQALTARSGWGSGHWNSGDGSWSTDAAPTYAQNANIGGAFPVGSVLDNFNAGANQSLDVRTGWSSLLLNGFSFITDATPTKATDGGGLASNIWNASAADCDAYVTILANTPSFDAFIVAARITATGTGTSTFYGVRIGKVGAGAANDFVIVKSVAGTVTAIGTLQSQAIASGDSIGIRVQGTTITSYYKSGAGSWTQKDSITDSSITGSGFVGGFAKVTASFTTEVDNFGGGAIATTPASNMWGTSFGPDMEAIITVGSVIDSMLMIVRGDSASASALTAGYLGRVGWNGVCSIERYTTTQLATITVAAPLAGDQFCLQARGPNITLWRKLASQSVWTVICSAYDTTYTGAGYIGIAGGSGNAPRVDAFGGGTAPYIAPVSDAGTVPFSLAPDAPVVVSQQFATNAATDVTTPITPTGIKPGNSLIVIFSDAGGLSTGAVTSVTDTGGNTYTLASNTGISGGTNTRLAVAYVQNCVAPGTITVNHGSIANRNIILLEVSGLQPVAHDDVQSDNTAGATTATLVPACTMSVADFALACVAHGGTTEDTPSAGWQLNTSGQPSAAAPIVRAAWRTFRGSGSTGTMTMTRDSRQATATMIAFKALVAVPSETISDAGTCTFAAAPTGVETISDQGTQPAILATQSQPPNQPVLDSFNSGALQALTARAGWGAGHNKSGDASFTTDAAPTYANEPGGAISNLWATSFPADQESVFVVGSTADTTGAIVRGNAAGSTPLTAGYELSYGWNGAWGVYPANSTTPLGSGGAGSFPNLAAGDSIALQVIGRWLMVWRKPSAGSWTLLAAVQDAVTTGAGYTGISAVSGASGRVDSFSAGQVGLPGTISDSGTCTFGGVTTAVETISDAATCTFVVAPTAVETPSDAATQAAVFSFTAGETVLGGDLSDAGTATFSITPTEAETIQDAGSTSFAVLPSAAETFSDAATVTQVLVPSASEQISDAGLMPFVVLPSTATEGPSETGSVTMVLPPSGADTLSDAATCVLVLLPTATERVNDSGSTSFTLSETAAEAFSDSATQNVVLAPTSAETPGDSGSCALSVTPTSAETFSDATSTTFVLAPTYDFIWPDSGTCTFVVTPTGAETFQDASTVIFVLTEADSERESDQGTVPVILTPSAGEALVDSGSQSAVLTPSATETPADAGAQAAVVDGTGAETLEDVGSTFVTLTPSQEGIEQGSQTIVLDSTATELISDAGTATMSIASTDAPQIQDAGSLAFVIAPTQVEGPVDYGTCVAALVQTAVETQVDAATVTVILLETAVEQPRDAGSVTFVLAPSAAETFQDTGTTLVVLTQTEFDAAGEVGTCTLALVVSATEQVQDAGTATLVFPETALERDSDAGTATFGIVSTAIEQVLDAGTLTFVVLPTTAVEAPAESATWSIAFVSSATETEVDAGTATLVFPETAAERDTDAGTASFALVATATEAVTDSGTVVIVLPETAVETPIWMDSGTATIAFSPSAAETQIDANVVSYALTFTSAESFIQASTQAFVLSETATEQSSDAGTVTVTLVPITTLAQPLEAGTCTFSVDGTAVETIKADTTISTQTVVLTPTYFGGAPGAVGNLTMTLSQTAVETIVGDPSAGTCVVVFDPSHTWTAGFDSSPQSPPLSGGDAADRRRHRDAVARSKALRAGAHEHRDRKLVRR